MSPAVPAAPESPWSAHRRRAEALRGRHGFAAEVLTLYGALLGVWEQAWTEARERPPEPERLAGWAARHVLPRVLDATAAAGPKALAASLDGLREAGEDILAAWLDGADDLAPAERYLAQASLRAPLAALRTRVAGADERHCPACGGPPQLSFRTDGGEALVSGRRRLLCARCGGDWGCTANICAGCGETSGERRTVYAEQVPGPRVGRGARDTDGALFPHLSAHACASCSGFLIDVDLGRDPRAVPEVDELAALPLGLYAVEQGYTKIAPNLMGL
ncbi:formate dehydrogenase accessory protein FdhE [Streptomyces sp. NPDC051940]|uniref:formate dehydrogenase accessory protein FdhE domain-containing protein n=1 Tax=Streptomyces sp. NPDC051940 TaxID=3155675 RepID=UPI0034483BA5